MINYTYVFTIFCFCYCRIKAGKFSIEQGQADERVNEALVYRSVVMSALYAFQYQFFQILFASRCVGRLGGSMSITLLSYVKTDEKKFNKGSKILEMKCYKQLQTQYKYPPIFADHLTWFISIEPDSFGHWRAMSCMSQRGPKSTVKRIQTLFMYFKRILNFLITRARAKSVRWLGWSQCNRYLWYGIS